MGLPKRLIKVASMVDKVNCGADIACDHAYLSRYLLKINKADYMIASDVNEGPLGIAKKTLATYSNCSETRLGYGLSTINDNEVDVVFICGLGAETIVEILKQDWHRFKNVKFVLQVNGDPSPLRCFLVDKPIKQEDIIKDRGHYYQIIVVKEGYPLGRQIWKNLRVGLRIGTLYKKTLGLEYIIRRLNDIEKALRGLQNDDLRGDLLRQEQRYYNNLLLNK